MDEAIGRDLLRVDAAWPLGRGVRGRQRFSTERLPVLDRVLRLEAFAVFRAHDFQPDRISETVQKRSAFEQTYARKIRPKTDHELPGDVLEAVQYNQMPQFTLRNIGRYEMAVDTEDPLPFQRRPGLGGDHGREIAEVRAARVPKPEMAQIWSVAYVARVRDSLRRLLKEDPWELRYGQEATSVFDGQRKNFIVEGTHPDDMPGADWGPTPIPPPATWQTAPPGEPAMERPNQLSDELARLTR